MYPDARGSPTGWSTQTGLTPMLGSRSRIASSTGVQAFSKAHGGRGTIRTVTVVSLHDLPVHEYHSSHIGYVQTSDTVCYAWKAVYHPL
jgi:hypothetical protein